MKFRIGDRVRLTANYLDDMRTNNCMHLVDEQTPTYEGIVTGTNHELAVVLWGGTKHLSMHQDNMELCPMPVALPIRHPRRKLIL